MRIVAQPSRHCASFAMYNAKRLVYTASTRSSAVHQPTTPLYTYLKHSPVRSPDQHGLVGVAHSRYARQLLVTNRPKHTITVISQSGGSFREAKSFHIAPTKYTTVTHDRHGAAIATRDRNQPLISEVFHTLLC
jgi:hypothetical protein